MYTYIFMTLVRVIPVSAVLSRVPYGCLYLQKWVTPELGVPTLVPLFWERYFPSGESYENH